MMKASARALMTIGIVLLFLAVVARFGGLSAANAVGDDLAIGASAVLVVVTGTFARYGR